MARTWPPVCLSFGCCSCTFQMQGSRLYPSGNPSQNCVAQQVNFQMVSQDDLPSSTYAASSTECQRFCDDEAQRIFGTQWGCNFDAPQYCGGAAYCRITATATGNFVPGQVCCGAAYPNGTVHPNACTGVNPPNSVDTCILNEFHNWVNLEQCNAGGTPTTFGECKSLMLTAQCNPPCCLPATSTDPIECINTSGQCCGAISGARLPGGNPCTSVDDPKCLTGQGCCLCDRCCDMDSQTCLNKGGTPMPASCSQTSTQSACTSARVKPSCKRGTWQAARRPAAHRAGSTINPPAGRWEPASIAKQRNMDVANVTGECKLSYGWVQRNNGRWEGKICNTYNNRCSSGKRAPVMNVVRKGGRWEWEGKYRIPCPEESEMGCNRRVTCPT